MLYEPVPESGAARWTTLLGLCLAMVAAGCFIAFSLVARDATQTTLDAPVVAVAPGNTSAPVITFGRSDDREPDGVRPSDDGRSIVLGSRVEDGPTSTVARAGTGRDGARDPRSRGEKKDVRDRDTDQTTVPARPTVGGDGKDKGKSKQASRGPSPNGKAKGHSKTHGKAKKRGKH